jgi:transcriptional antiterminator NusG
MKEDLEQSAETVAAEAQAEAAATVEAPAETPVETPAAEAEANAAEPETATATEPPAGGGEAPTAAATPEPVKNENFRWYILHAYSGFERKVRESIESRVQAFGLRERVGRVMIPTEPVTEIINGKKRTVERVFLPGYVLVEMELDNELWHVLKDTPKVTGFLGTGDKPVALSEEEVSSILFRSETSKDKPRMKIKFEKGEQVRITDGPFANFNGVVDEVNEDRETLKVMVTIFGRSTPVELEFGKVEKIE